MENLRNIASLGSRLHETRALSRAHEKTVGGRSPELPSEIVADKPRPAHEPVATVSLARVFRPRTIPFAGVGMGNRPLGALFADLRITVRRWDADASRPMDVPSPESWR